MKNRLFSLITILIACLGWGRLDFTLFSRFCFEYESIRNLNKDWEIDIPLEYEFVFDCSSGFTIWPIDMTCYYVINLKETNDFINNFRVEKNDDFEYHLRDCYKFLEESEEKNKYFPDFDKTYHWQYIGHLNLGDYEGWDHDLFLVFHPDSMILCILDNR